MKNLMLLLLIVLVSCGDKQEQKEDPMKPKRAVSQDMELSGSYILKQLRGETIYSEDITFTLDRERKELRGNAGCNRFSAHYERDGDQITFEQPASTKMFCEGKMEREQEIIGLLSQITGMREEGNTVEFTSNNGEVLMTVEKTDDRE